MSSDLEKAKIIFKLTRKNNWGACYDRAEHFKRFQNFDKIIKQLSKIRWIIVNKKPNFINISLNTQFKKEIIGFIEKEMPYDLFGPTFNHYVSLYGKLLDKYGAYYKYFIDLGEIFKKIEASRSNVEARPVK